MPMDPPHASMAIDSISMHFGLYGFGSTIDAGCVADGQPRHVCACVHGVDDVAGSIVALELKDRRAPASMRPWRCLNYV